MVGCGLPELMASEEVAWPRNVLALDKPDREAEDSWPILVERCLKKRYRQLDDDIQ